MAQKKKRKQSGRNIPYEESYEKWRKRTEEYREEIASILPGFERDIRRRERRARHNHPTFLDSVDESRYHHHGTEGQGMNLTMIMLALRTDWRLDAWGVNMGCGNTPLHLPLIPQITNIDDPAVVASRYSIKPNNDLVICDRKKMIMGGRMEDFPQLLKENSQYFPSPKPDLVVWSNMWNYMSKSERIKCLRATWKGLKLGGYFITAEEEGVGFAFDGAESIVEELPDSKSPAFATYDAVRGLKLPFDRIYAVGHPISQAHAIILRKSARTLK